MGQYITEADLATLREGSYEGVIEGVEVAASAALGRDVRAVATWADHAVVVDDAERFTRVAFARAAGAITVEGHAPYEAVATRGEDAIPAYVAGQARALVRDVAEGRADPAGVRTRVRHIAHLIEAGERYWLVDAVAELEAARDDAWHAWYAADAERIRRKVWGEVRAREGRVPTLPAEGATAAGVRAATEALGAALAQILDEARSVTFDKKGTDLDAIRCSLIGEAEAMVAALQGAGRLMLEDVPRDIARMARAHAACAERARHMGIVAGYLAQRGRGANERGDGNAAQDR
jgi:hypothetical protein